MDLEGTLEMPFNFPALLIIESCYLRNPKTAQGKCYNPMVHS